MHGRVGPSVVGGNAEKGVSMSEQVGSPLAFAIDIGHRFNEKLYLGGLLAGGVGLVHSSPCPEGYECSNAGLGAFGPVVRYHLSPIGELDPWVGGGVAFSVQAEKAKRYELASGGGFCLFACGPSRIEFVRDTTRYGADLFVEGGVDVRLSRRFGLGVGLAAFAGQYLGAVTSEKRNKEEISSDGRGVDGGLHVWALLSVHAVFNFDKSAAVATPAAPTPPPAATLTPPPAATLTPPPAATPTPPPAGRFAPPSAAPPPAPAPPLGAAPPAPAAPSAR
jgi:hypothetical protein